MQRWRWQASGGDDYELCFTATPRNRELVLQALDFAEVAVTRIGRIVALVASGVNIAGIGRILELEDDNSALRSAADRRNRSK